VRIALTRELAELHPAVESFVAERVERNVEASLLVRARAGHLSQRESLFARAATDEGELVFFAMHTPPWPLLVTELTRAHAAPSGPGSRLARSSCGRTDGR
jgi:hypothetical protein